ncbi:MAG: transketolase C-terminal domain-containing protein, partial [bacterium]|nr:transketolase C-terminal domain-containing protein [bacterium]
ARFVKPLDVKMLRALSEETNCFVTVEENVLMGGFGSAVLEALEAARLDDIRLLRIGLPDRFIEHGSQRLLRQQYGLDPEGIVARIEGFIRQQDGARMRSVHDETTSR